MSRRDGFDFTDQLLCTPNDEAHKQYFVPLPNAEDERLAHSMADVIIQPSPRGSPTTSRRKKLIVPMISVWLIDRRMLCDEEYLTIFCC